MVQATTVHRDRSIGVRVGFPAGNNDRAVRAWAFGLDQLGKMIRAHGYVYSKRRITTATFPADAPEYRDDVAWEETTYLFRPTLLDRAAAPVVARIRRVVSYAAARAVHTRRVIDAARAGNWVANRVMDAGLWIRHSEHVHTDRELAKRLGYHPFEWSKRT